MIAIVAILSALVLGTLGALQAKSASNRARVEIDAVSDALENYKRDHGDYPVNTDTNHNKPLAQALAPATGKGYHPLAKNQTNAAGDFVDPFGNAYGYYYTTNTNDPIPGEKAGAGTFSIWSTANQPANSNAWLTSW